MENDITDALLEVRNVAADAAVEEQAIRDLEHEIAEQMRGICTDLFDGTTQYRLPKTELKEDWDCTRAVVYRRIGAVLGTLSDGEIHLRITTKGRIIVALVHTDDDDGLTQVLDGSVQEPAEWQLSCLYRDTCRPATDREVAAHAPALAEQLIAAMRKRIDTAREHKATLARVRDAMAGDAA